MIDVLKVALARAGEHVRGAGHADFDADGFLDIDEFACLQPQYDQDQLLDRDEALKVGN